MMVSPMAASFRFELVAQCPATGARAGRLYTPHGVVETPVFMPVGTHGAVKSVRPQDLLEELGSKILLANTYHLYLRPGHEVIARLGGLHRYAGWPRAILTDSGGFQVFSLSDLRKVSDEGVLFRSHLDGEPHMFTPERALEVQLALGSDIMVVLDECVGYPADRETVEKAVERTTRWAERSFQLFEQRKQAGFVDGRALFAIVQGGMFADLRRRSATQLLGLPADGYAIGGLSVGEPRQVSLEMVEVTASLLPVEKPRYVMGVGMPEELVEYVARGIDMMDCVIPSRNARNGCLFTRQGRVLIKQARYKDDPRPVDEHCLCSTCRTYSRSFLRHLFLAGESLYGTLATIHNLRYYLDIMSEIRQAILLGTFPAYLEAQRARREEEGTGQAPAGEADGRVGEAAC